MELNLMNISQGLRALAYNLIIPDPELSISTEDNTEILQELITILQNNPNHALEQMCTTNIMTTKIIPLFIKSQKEEDKALLLRVLQCLTEGTASKNRTVLLKSLSQNKICEKIISDIAESVIPDSSLTDTAKEILKSQFRIVCNLDMCDLPLNDENIAPSACQINERFQQVLIHLMSSKDKECWAPYVGETLVHLFKDENNSRYLLSSLKGSLQTNLETVDLSTFTRTLMKTCLTDMLECLQNILSKREDSQNPDEPYKRKVENIYLWIISTFISPKFLEYLDDKEEYNVMTIGLLTKLCQYTVKSFEKVCLHETESSVLCHCIYTLHKVITALVEIQKEKIGSEALEFQAAVLTEGKIQNYLLLLIRECSHRNIQLPMETLSQLIMTNHHVLMMIDSCQRNKLLTDFNIVSHVSQFADSKILLLYGRMLDQYFDNSYFLNECIITVMHHIAGDCGYTERLIQYPLIETFSNLSDDDYEIPEELEELIERVFLKFMEMADNSERMCIRTETEWTESESTYLCIAYIEKYDDYLRVPEYCHEIMKRKNIFKTKTDILGQLNELNLITAEQAREIYVYMTNRQNESPSGKVPAIPENLQSDDLIQFCITHLIDGGYSEYLTWLQKWMLGHCKSERDCYERTPLLPFTDRKIEFLDNMLSVRLLSELGILLPEEDVRLFHYLPDDWSIAVIYYKAGLLNVNQAELEFEVEQFTGQEGNEGPITMMDTTEQVKPRSESSMPQNFWCHAINKYNTST